MDGALPRGYPAIIRDRQPCLTGRRGYPTGRSPPIGAKELHVESITDRWNFAPSQPPRRSSKRTPGQAQLRK